MTEPEKSESVNVTLSGRKRPRSSKSSKDEQAESLANVIKNVHKNLKKQFLKSGDADTIWKRHVQETETLKSYAEAMHSLATQHWRSGDGNRIEWIHKTCDEYFHKGGMVKWLEKDARRREYHNQPEPEISDAEKSSAGEKEKLKLLDVGSCYNPFSVYDSYSVIGVDLQPACDTVYQCDFLNVELKNDLLIEENSIRSLPELGYDIVVFCLLLEYLPSPDQRFQCVMKCWRLLKFYGLLVIITPDSHRQHRGAARMKDWKIAIESVGFHRIKYEKLEHLHGLAFRKIARVETPNSDMAQRLYVPQDFNTELSSDDGELSDDNEEEGSKSRKVEDKVSTAS